LFSFFILRLSIIKRVRVYVHAHVSGAWKNKYATGEFSPRCAQISKRSARNRNSIIISNRPYRGSVTVTGYSIVRNSRTRFRADFVIRFGFRWPSNTKIRSTKTEYSSVPKILHVLHSPTPFWWLVSNIVYYINCN